MKKNCQSPAAMKSAVISFLVLFAFVDFPVVAQEGKSVDLEWREALRCGPNSLYVILLMHGKKTDYQSLASKFHLTQKGANASDLARVSAEYGLPLEPLRANAKSLPDLPLPAIVHFHNSGMEVGHFVVLLSINADDSFTIIECTRGEMERLSRGDFLDRWSGVILVKSEYMQDRNLKKMMLVSSGMLLLLLPVCVLEWKKYRVKRINK